MPPLMVAGLPGSDVAYVQRRLRQLGFDIVPTRVVPAWLDRFVAEGGLLVWVLADTAARWQIAGRQRARSRTSLEALQAQRDAMFEDWRRMVLDERPHLGYAFRLTHIVLHHDGDQNALEQRLKELAADLQQGLRFTPRQTQSLAPLPLAGAIGESAWEVKYYGHPAPETQSYTSAPRHRPHPQGTIVAKGRSEPPATKL